MFVVVDGLLLAESGVSFEATRHLRDAIRAGRFGPGDRIVERVVADELDISPIAVRDAFARLVQEGWIERVPRRGVRVPLLHPAQVQDILAARALVEGQAAALAADRIATAGDADLRLVPPAMGRAARRQDVAALLTLDDAFHRALWTLGGSAALEGLLGTLRARVTPLVRLSLQRMSAAQLLEMEAWHAELLDAVRAGPGAARAAVQRHSDLTRDRVLGAATTA